MKCRNKDIKELLPAYAEQGLAPSDRLRVEEHLASCADCAGEAALLSVVTGEPVPDPGDAFWDEMPETVYRAVRAEEARKAATTRDISSLLDKLVLPRWAWVTASIGIVAMVSWLVLHPAAVDMAEITEEYAYAEAESTLIVDLDDLGTGELETISGWADSQFASLGGEFDESAFNGTPQEIDEELGELTAQELERFSRILERMDTIPEIERG